MILILDENADLQSDEFRQLTAQLDAMPDIKSRVHQIQGTERVVTEIYLLGNTKALQLEDMRALPLVEQAIRVSEEYRVLGRHKDDTRPAFFEYQGLRFGQDTLHVFAGLCAVDTREHVEQMMRALKESGQSCTRMGAYKPRTRPYSFQGHGKSCLPWHGGRTSGMPTLTQTRLTRKQRSFCLQAFVWNTWWSRGRSCPAP